MRDELEESRDKPLIHPSVKVAAFVVNSVVDRRKHIEVRIQEIAFETGTERYLFSFQEWLEYQLEGLDSRQRDVSGERWLMAVVESFAQKRPEAAPVGEPCDAWIEDLMRILKNRKEL